MPQYSVEEVLDIIKNLSTEDKSRLQAQLSSVLETTPSGTLSGRNAQSQSQNFGNVSASGSGSVAIDQIASGGDTSLTQSNTQVKAESGNLQEALQLLQQLQQDVATTSMLNGLEKNEVEAKIIFLQKELKKEKPDKSLIDQAIEGLEKGLKGVLVLAKPVQKVAELIGQAWMLL